MKLSKNDIKNALWHENFRTLFPELKKEIDSFLQKPGCSCNNGMFAKFMQYPERLKQYFPTKEIEALTTNQEFNWTVINCHIEELETKLKQLGDVPKYVSIARYEDQVTVIIGEMI